MNSREFRYKKIRSVVNAVMIRENLVIQCGQLRSRYDQQVLNEGLGDETTPGLEGSIYRQIFSPETTDYSKKLHMVVSGYFIVFRAKNSLRKLLSRPVSSQISAVLLDVSLPR